MDLQKRKLILLKMISDRPLDDAAHVKKLLEIMDLVVCWTAELREAQKAYFRMCDKAHGSMALEIRASNRELEGFMDFVVGTLRFTTLKPNYTIEDVNRIAIQVFGEKGLNT